MDARKINIKIFFETYVRRVVDLENLPVANTRIHKAGSNVNEKTHASES